VGTDIGVFASSDTNGSSWGVLGNGLPNVPITHLALKPGDPDTLVAATYGRGVYLYHFADPPPATGGATGPASGVQGKQVACRIAPGFARFTTNPSRRGLRLRAVGKKNVRAAVAVYRYTSGAEVIRAKRVVSFGDARTFHLSSPVFGGSNNAPLQIDYRTGRAGHVTVTLVRGRKTIKRLAAIEAAAGRTYRVRLPANGLKPGAYRVRMTLSGAGVRTLVSRRL
jgi:hypothetical protein